MAQTAFMEEFTEVGLFLPELINRGLSARERLTYYVTLLQAAQAYAQAPHPPAPTLRAEREASGIADAMLDEIVAASRTITTDITRIPGAGAIVDLIFSDLREMLQPLKAAAVTRPELADRLEIYERRLERQLAIGPPCQDDNLTATLIDGLARRTQNGHDSVHQLALDLQCELDHLSKAVSPETIDGATGYGLAATDRAMVRAFMRGVNQTKALKFDRPGLRTSAARDGDRLSIHSALGTDNAQRFIVHVHGLAATVVYSDRHRARTRFLHDMLLVHDVHWEASPVAAGANYERSLGTYAAETAQDMERFLTFTGSRLVFLIDWNRARKRLGRFVGNTDAIAVLKWAADNDVGHQGFLQAGGARLVYTALERALPPKVRYGARLDDLLGSDASRSFLRSVLGIAASGLGNDRSMRLIEDEVEAEFLAYLRTSGRTVLGAATEHATVVAEMAEELCRVLARVTRGAEQVDDASVCEDITALAARAHEIARRSSRLLDQTGEAHQLRRLLSETDDAASSLEEAAFLVTLVPVKRDEKVIALLDGMADLISRGAREYVLCLQAAHDLAQTAARPAIERFLVSVDQIAGLRQRADIAERAIRKTLVVGPAACCELYVSSALAREFEQTAQRLGRCAVMVRDHVRNDLTRTT
jgi:uncharacterized protein Yka (UPF0111/DUF47 family)